MTDIFISYSKARKQEAGELATELGDLGYNVWWDTSLVPTGSFGEEIDRQLDAAKAVIVIWSPESIRSKWVRSEAYHADREEKLVNTHTSEISDPSRQIPKPCDVTHSVLLDDIRALIGALDCLNVPRSGGNVMTGEAALVTGPSIADADDRLFEEVERRGVLEAYQYYLSELPEGRHALVAKMKLRDLERELAAEQAAVEQAAREKAAKEAAAEAKRRQQQAEAEHRKKEGAVDFLVGIGSASERRFLKPGDKFRDAPFAPEMVVIKPGKFMMGSPDSEPYREDNEIQHEVTISKPFAMGRYAVTFDEWDAYVSDSKGGKGAYHPDDQGWGRGRRPVISVSWHDAQAYIEWLNDKTSHIYRLPTEAEWEYAARAGTDTPFWCGSTISTDQANYHGNYPYNNGAKGKYRGMTVPVDSFEPNPFGLYQVHGNVWEWCNDWYRDYKKGSQTDPKGPGSDSGSARVLRGGGWNYYAGYLRSALRYYYSPDARYYDLGFRLLRQPS